MPASVATMFATSEDTHATARVPKVIAFRIVYTNTLYASHSERLARTSLSGLREGAYEARRWAQIRVCAR
jgi:hypothetical protein